MSVLNWQYSTECNVFMFWPRVFLSHYLSSLQRSVICSFEQVHLDYLEAGADIIITASYQVNSHCLSRVFVLSV